MIFQERELRFFFQNNDSISLIILCITESCDFFKKKLFRNILEYFSLRSWLGLDGNAYFAKSSSNVTCELLWPCLPPFLCIGFLDKPKWVYLLHYTAVICASLSLSTSDLDQNNLSKAIKASLHYNLVKK